MMKNGHLCWAALVILLSGGCDKPEPEDPAHPPAKEAAWLSNGMTEQEVIDLLGEPVGSMSGGSRSTLMYDGVQIQFVDGKAVDLPEDISDLVQQGRSARAERDAFTAKQKKKGLVLHNGQWVKPKDVDTSSSTTSEPSGKRKAVYVMRNNRGDPISHDAIIRRGQVTVVDFYADWCGPCKALDPKLKALVQKHNVTLKKVNIYNWGSDTARRYNVTSVPNVRVFDREGNMIGPPTSSLSAIDTLIARAKKQ